MQISGFGVQGWGLAGILGVGSTVIFCLGFRQHRKEKKNGSPENGPFVPSHSIYMGRSQRLRAKGGQQGLSENLAASKAALKGTALGGFTQESGVVWSLGM